MREPDVVIVGGGIAGASLATALARAGRAVLVLEATEQYTDRVRGESMMPWGVAEAGALGVADVLMAAGAHVAPVWRRYGGADLEPREIPVGLLVRGVGGTLNLEHPVACQALLDASVAAGAAVQRGVERVALSSSPAGPVVTFECHGRSRAARPRVVVGADGRSSTTRRTAGIELDRFAATAVISGLLLDGIEGPDDHDVVVEHDLGMSLLIHQRAGRARAYHVMPMTERARFSGPDGARRFVADLAASPVLSERLTAARPAGPCATFPNAQTGSALPAVDGVVLLGDAAGQSDPAIGCGLSMAMRDARIVRDLLLDGAMAAGDFADYGRERAERLRRLRLIAEVMFRAVVEPGADRGRRRARFSEAMATFDPAVFPLMVGMFAGPETVPGALVDAGVPSDLRAA